MPKPITSENCTMAEFDACVEVYLEMLSKEKSRIPYRKADYRSQLIAGVLKKRSEEAFEYRMQNISFVLYDLGQQFIIGYKPAKHVGTNTFNLISRSLERNGFISPNDFEPTPDADELQRRAKRIKKGIDLKNSPSGQRIPRKVETIVTTFIGTVQ